MAKLLILDDDFRWLQFVKGQLDDTVLEVVCYNNVDEAVAKCEATSLTAAIIDLHMPRGDTFTEEETVGSTETGLAFARHLRRKNPHIDIIVMSAYRSPSAVGWCELNNVKFIDKKEAITSVKPFIQQVLQSINGSREKRLAPLFRLLERFGAVARWLEERHSGVPPLLLENEYDVQYLLGALLQVEFDDVRRETWNASVAGAQSRVDFVLPKLRVFIETKFVYDDDGGVDKKLGNELLQDIGRYSPNEECESVVFFIYDKSKRMKNPTAFRSDIEAKTDAKCAYFVRISP